MGVSVSVTILKSVIAAGGVVSFLGPVDFSHPEREIKIKRAKIKIGGVDFIKHTSYVTFAT
jgi:hypothetical protein